MDIYIFYSILVAPLKDITKMTNTYRAVIMLSVHVGTKMCT